MKIDDIKSVYFIGVGGIGMSALARYFLANGKTVGGYDRTLSPLTVKLSEEGVPIHYEEMNLEDGLFHDFLDPATTLVVYTPAVPSDHAELMYFREHGFEVLKRSQTLGLITKSARGLCVAGTHGKTTTSSMIAHLLKQSAVDCNAFLGGIIKNYDSNLMLSDRSDLTVIEADEYDRSFHTLTPYMAVVTAADPDHLDIYGTPAAYRESFEQFTSLIRPGGALIIKKGVDIKPRLQDGVKMYTYSMTDRTADFHAENIRVGNGEIVFDLEPFSINDVSLGVPVRINVENAVAAMAVALLNGVTPEEARAAIKTFAGAERRFDFQVKTDRVVYIDDYAHHPQELASAISSVRELYVARRLTGIFQPHLYTRTRDFSDDFARALSLLDRLILLDIYPAREEPIPNVTSEIIFDKVTIADKVLCHKDELMSLLESEDLDVLMTLGAGDIDRFVEPIRNMLNDKYRTK